MVSHLIHKMKKNLLRIGGFIGRAIDTDLTGSGVAQWRRCVRVRVVIDISCPLIFGFPLDREGLPDIWIPFKFEKLGNFCYGCGRLGHEQRDCTNNEVQLQRQVGVEVGPFGSWLRVDNNSFQPGLNPNLLLEFDRVECRMRMGQSLNLVTDEEAANQWSS